MGFADADYPADPYPGCRPEVSYVHHEGTGHPLVPVPPPRAGCVTLRAPSGYVLADQALDLDRWLAERDAPPLAGRAAVLAYGSNSCPAKLTWLREQFGMTGPVVLLRAVCTGVAAVWAAGVRAHDGQRPVTLVAAPGEVEDHFVWLATPEQLDVLDRCEGNGVRYIRKVLPKDVVAIEGGLRPDEVQAYLGHSPERMPLLVDGRPVRATEVEQWLALGLLGDPAKGHGLFDVTGSG